MGNFRQFPSLSFTFPHFLLLFFTQPANKIKPKLKKQPETAKTNNAEITDVKIFFKKAQKDIEIHFATFCYNALHSATFQYATCKQFNP